MFSFECFAVTHIGNYRVNNEDNFFIGELLTPTQQKSMSQTGIRQIGKRAKSNTNRLFAVTDGMGGHEQGEAASFIVADSLREFVAENGACLSSERKEKFEYVEAFQRMVRRTNQKILEHPNKGNIRRMGATLSGLFIFCDEAAPINIGDSSTFVIEQNTLEKLTVDNNEMSMLKSIESVAMLPSNGRRLIKYFGLPRENGVLTATISRPLKLKDEQIFVIATDGLTDDLSFNEILKIVEENKNNIEKAAVKLIESALNKENGGGDNITVIVLKVHEEK
ncbi:MAG: serine/threonine-protein phosphatase [Oscillospiraceae bacterium]|nr:serine/threonine-protein phosphatase [Oscillospiraceae bacterium]